MSLLEPLADIGRYERTGGYRRYAWTSVDMAMREWFAAEAASLGLDVMEDCIGSRLTTGARAPERAMLFVRNPTGALHSPDEHASDDDCEAGVAAPERTIRELA